MSALFLTYRPQTFQDLVGQDSIVKTLRNTLKTQRMSHAYLFCGSRGTGKTSTARIFAKGLNCQNLSDGSPCGSCEMCQNIAKGHLVDVIEIDAASNRGIDEIRELRERVLFSPNIAARKVYIIDEVHMLTKEAFNALLKTLEEPPDHAYFLLATTEFHKIPETIKSRCQTFIFQKFGLQQLVDRLEFIAQKEKISIKRPSLELIARKAEGGMRDGISLLEQIAAETEQNVSEEAVRSSLGISSTESLENFWQAILEKDQLSGLEIIRNIANAGADFRTFGHDFLSFLQTKLHESLENPTNTKMLLESIEAFQKALSQLKTSPIVELPFEVALIQLTLGTSAAIAPPQKKQTDASPTQSKPTVAPTAKSNEKVSSTVPKSPKQSPDPADEFLQPSSPSVPEKNASKRTPQNHKKEAPTPETPSTAHDDLHGFIFDGPRSKEERHQKLKSEESPNPVPKKTTQQKITSTESVSLSIENLLSKMSEIAEKSGLSPFAKKSFLTTKPQIEEERIVFYTDSMFHYEKLTPNNVKNPIESTIQEYFKVSFTVDFANPKKSSFKQKAARPSAPAKEKATIDDFLNF